jgi:hypothetical protein
MKDYQITFEWPNGDWTWLNTRARDYHQIILMALDACPTTCRVRRIEFLTPAQAATKTTLKAKQ